MATLEETNPIANIMREYVMKMLGGANVDRSEAEANTFANIIPGASANMPPTVPTIPDSNLPRPQYTEQSQNPFPMTGQLRSADNTPGIQAPALSRIDQYLSQLRGPKKPMPGTRPQQFANIPQQGPGSEFFRNF